MKELIAQLKDLTTSKNAPVSAGALSDIFTALQLIQSNGGQGTVKVSMSDEGIFAIDTFISAKPARKQSLGKHLQEKWLRSIRKWRTNA